VPHINVFGGEDRFWLGPEGGQFSIFFAKDGVVYFRADASHRGKIGLSPRRARWTG
jgi:hypothetical protein